MGRSIERFLDTADTAPAGDEPLPERVVTALLQDAVRERASDIHLEPFGDAVVIRFRVDGALHDVTLLGSAVAERLANQIKGMAELDPVPTFRPQESRFRVHIDARDLDVRLTITPCLGGQKLVLRILDPQRVGHQLNELGLDGDDLDTLGYWVDHADGLFLCTGPTGSGKTTTLYALLHLFKVQEKSVVTLEDPVEYHVPGITQIQVDETHALDFAKGLKAMDRLDPDYLMVGEIRDAESAIAAMRAATTGKVLLSTLHCRDAVAAVTVLRNRGLSDHDLAASLRVVVAQRLVRTLCNECRTEHTPTDGEKHWLASLDRKAPERCYTATGCDMCNGIGYAGRRGIFEVWQLRDDDIDRILAGADERQLRRRLANRGHRTFIDDGLHDVGEGRISLAELRRVPAVGPVVYRRDDEDADGGGI